jgi:hypothetical protein
MYAHVGVVVSQEGPAEWLCTLVGREICDFLAGEDNHVLDLVQYPYMGMDWRGCPNILFTIDEPTYERGNIIIMF